MFEYLEAADERFVQQSRNMMQQTRENAAVYAGLMAPWSLLTENEHFPFYFTFGMFLRLPNIFFNKKI